MDQNQNHFSPSIIFSFWNFNFLQLGWFAALTALSAKVLKNGSAFKRELVN